MSSAGVSAGDEAERSRREAELHRAAADAALQRAERYEIAARSEKRTVQAMAGLVSHGYHLLIDRQWPGSRHANVDLIVVGPGGLFIVDTKAWVDLTIVLDRVFRDQEDVTETFENLMDLADKTAIRMADEGLAPSEVHAVVAWAGRKGVRQDFQAVNVVGDADLVRFIGGFGQRLSTAQVERLYVAALDWFRPMGVSPVPTATVDLSVAPAPPDTFNFAELPTPEEIDRIAFEALLAAPLEDWMTFLAPEQARIASRGFRGPARLRGAAGTGKTVVGLHRAAYLARTKPYGRILFTTFVKSLPAVLASLLKRFAPDVADRVDFVHVHGFATDLLRERGVPFRLDGRRARSAFDQAWSSVGHSLRDLEPSIEYWREEIDSVIKGRGFVRFEEYSNSSRVGRRRPLLPAQRRLVWELFEQYQTTLQAAQVHDFADVILKAERALELEPMNKYAAVIVDEAQDLSCAMIRMLYSLVGDVPDGLTLIGDGQQTIYPGGYTLAEAGISLSGRGVILSTNYRNTAEILEAASRVVEGDGYTDIEDVAPTRFEGNAEVARHGPPPENIQFHTTSELRLALIERIKRVTASIGTGTGDVAVLCMSNDHAKSAITLLEEAGFTTVELHSYAGQPTDAIKVGTIYRAKGLEFKQVLLPWISGHLLEHSDTGLNDSQVERAERDRRVLYVGMTRARDGLWIGSVRS